MEASDDFLAQMGERMKREPMRSQKRKEEGDVDLHQGRCIITTDLTLLPAQDGEESGPSPTICVEIKVLTGIEVL